MRVNPLAQSDISSLTNRSKGTEKYPRPLMLPGVPGVLGLKSGDGGWDIEESDMGSEYEGDGGTKERDVVEKARSQRDMACGQRKICAMWPEGAQGGFLSRPWLP